MNSIRCRQCEHYIEANAGEGKIYGCDRSKCVFEPTTKNDLEVDCISRADAIKAMQDKAKKLKNEDTINGLCGAVAILFDMPSVTPQESRWIPVSERLPEAEYGESNSVLVCFANGTQDVLYFDGSNWRYPTGESYISVNHKNGWHNKVIAWMPLPKPYKAEAEPQESESDA